MSVELTALIGSVAAVFTTGAFVSQIVKIRRQGGRDVSYLMLAVFIVGVGLWLMYGIMTAALPVILANAVTGVLVLVALGLKWRQERPGARLAPTRRRRIAIDMDDVLADTLAKHLRMYNEAFGTQLTRDDMAGRSIERAVPAAHVAALRAMVDAPGFFRDLAVMPGSQEVVRALSERYDVFIATSAMEVPASFADKFAWLQEHFPFIQPSNIMFVGDKSAVAADFLIDDSPRHFARFTGTPILFSAPQNRDETRYQRVVVWRDVAAILLAPETPAPRELAPEPELVTTA